MRIEIPELSLIAMVGASSSGKTTFANRHFGDSFVLSSDFFRKMVSDDENDQSVTKEAFGLLYQTAETRLKLGKRTVIDATNLQAADRRAILKLAKEQNVHAAAVVLDIPEHTLLLRNEERTGRNLSPQAIRRQYAALQKSIKSLKKEGFRFVYVLSEKEVEDVEIVYTKLWNDKTEEHGPFDIIGDVHGCCDELEELLLKLGYRDTGSGYAHPDGRKAVFIGDLTDRGPRNADTLRLVMKMVSAGNAFCTAGNHDNKLERYLSRRNVTVSHGLETTIEELEREGDSFKTDVRKFLSSLVSYYRLDDGKLVVTHAGIRQEYVGRASAEIRDFCLYGDTNGETDGFGLPVRLDWADDYRGDALIVYGHTPTAEVRVKNHTWCIDTGCVFGGKLTAFRYPERELAAVDAHKEYYKPVRPLEDSGNNNTAGPAYGSAASSRDGGMTDSGTRVGAGTADSRNGANARTADSENETAVCITDTGTRADAPDTGTRASARTADSGNGAGVCLHAEDVIGKHFIRTSLMKGGITIREEQSASALEIMSRFGADPRWLIYLPPTMSPCETSRQEAYLEYPAEAFQYYEKNGVAQIVCEKKHMGSRAAIVLCHTADAAERRFGVSDGSRGILYTRTGRRFFDDPGMENEILARLDQVLTKSGFWEDFATDWVIFDAELMPWSEKAGVLLQTQYAPVGRAGRESLGAAVELIKKAEAALSGSQNPGGAPVPGRDLDLGDLLRRFEEKQDAMDRYVNAYRNYCWKVHDVSDIRIAPFHLLASEGNVFDSKTHVWHMETIKKYCTGTDALFMATDYVTVHLSSEEEKKTAVDWWLALTENGGEGMVVKPMDFIAWKGNSILQPAVKCRGREYLRIIYGPEYLLDGHLERLKKRSLSRKQALARQEFALGLESLHRFVAGEPLRRIHECVFGVLALESEPVDARL